jgi:hypothetical protein
MYVWTEAMPPPAFERSLRRARRDAPPLIVTQHGRRVAAARILSPGHLWLSRRFEWEPTAADLRSIERAAESGRHRLRVA